MNERRRTLLFSSSNIPTENGVYIESVDHEFYLPNNWDSANIANSIAVVTDAHSFRIALQFLSHTTYMNGNATDTWEKYLSRITTSNKAKTDYSGATNTQLIVEKCQPSTEYAAGWCNAYTFPDGVTKGYLPALGELYLAYQNKDEVDAALWKCGSTAFPTQYHWSSTFYGVEDDNRKGWRLHWGVGEIIKSGVSYFGYAHPFAVLEDSN